MDGAQGISQKIANEAESVSASTEEQAATAQEMSDASRMLAGMAEKLQNDVAKFQL